MSISPYRGGFQPLKAPSLTLRTYGTAGKWSTEAVKARGIGAASGTASASDFFLGPQKTGTDWAAAFSAASASGTDAAMQDYVKRNYEKFSGATLEAMLEATGLVDWYKETMQKQIAAITESLGDSQDGLGDAQDGLADLSADMAALTAPVDVTF